MAGFIDDDSMGTASATTLATSESVKAYVDAQVTASDDDLTVAGDSGSFVINLDSETLGIKTGGGLTSAAAGSDVTVSLDTTITGMTSITSTDFVGDLAGDVTSTGTSVFNNITLNGAISGGAITQANSINLTNEPSSASDHYITFSSSATGY